ncbi:holo-ACP synthase [Streptomyces sp. NPDC053048]|uniref:holo-ACP synthase n=1 Tax=Streptomyces sp. NPDC053048 TaxID=3365694 RepID=UPI0037D1AB3F
MPRRVGIDLVPFSRVRAMLDRGEDDPTARMLTAREIGLCYRGDVPDIPGIAGRLAAKEAVFKLFHSVHGPLPWQGIEVLKGPGGWPEVRLSGRAARLARDARIEHIEISIAHDEPCAIAVACVAHP